MPHRVPAPSQGTLSTGVLVVLLILTVSVEACGPRVPPLAHAARSPEALASAVAAGLERADAAGLRALTLSEQEFRDHVWPDLPAARPERNLPFSYVWGDLRQKSDSSLARILAGYGGRRLPVAGVRFAGGTTQYATYLVHRDTRIALKDGDGAGGDEIQLFGSVLEKDGRFKVFSYVVD